MAKYAVKMKPSAEKELDRLSGKLNARIFSRLESLAFDPRPPGCCAASGLSDRDRLDAHSDFLHEYLSGQPVRPSPDVRSRRTEEYKT